MGCHTWVTVRNRELEEHIKNINVLREEIKTWLTDSILRIERDTQRELQLYPDRINDTNCTVYYSKVWIRRYKHLLYFTDKFSDKTIIKLWFRTVADALDRQDVDGKCWSASKKFHDPFRYYNYHQEYKLDNFESVVEFMFNRENHCEFRSYLGHEYHDIKLCCDATDEEREELMSRIKEIFDQEDEPFITFE